MPMGSEVRDEERDLSEGETNITNIVRHRVNKERELGKKIARAKKK